MRWVCVCVCVCVCVFLIFKRGLVEDLSFFFFCRLFRSSHISKVEIRPPTRSSNQLSKQSQWFYLSFLFLYSFSLSLSLSPSLCASLSLFFLSPVSKVGSVGCVGFLVEGTSAWVLVDESRSCLSGGHVHVWWCILGCLWPYYDFRQPLC